MKKLVIILAMFCTVPLASSAQDADTTQNIAADSTAEAQVRDSAPGSGSSVKRNVKLHGVENYKDLADYLPGRVAGVTVSGPEGGRVVIIRGINTFTGTVGALIIIDGVKMTDFEAANSAVDIKDIQSVEVIMDGAEFGSEGANGVVVITTRTGADNGDKDNGTQPQKEKKSSRKKK